MELEEGLDYRLTIRGANLSGGQKQRVLISRSVAAVRKFWFWMTPPARWIIRRTLDLRQALRARFQGTTTLIVAQRVSSILHADHVTDAGKR